MRHNSWESRQHSRLEQAMGSYLLGSHESMRAGADIDSGILGLGTAIILGPHTVLALAMAVIRVRWQLIRKWIITEVVVRAGVGGGRLALPPVATLDT